MESSSSLLISACLFVLLTAGILPDVQAASLDKKAAALCQHVRACVLSEIERQQVSPEVKKALMQSMSQEMCSSILNDSSDYGNQYDELADKAADCVDSMLELSCDQLLRDQVRTRACERYEEAFSNVK